MSKIVLYQPDIAGNVGSIIRSCVAFNSDLHIIEPCGFVFDINRIKIFFSFSESFWLNNRRRRTVNQ
jgi:tRNA(Leu) C34 or U34 (ribose-2'-O)-methylase TrmL